MVKVALSCFSLELYLSKKPSSVIVTLLVISIQRLKDWKMTTPISGHLEIQYGRRRQNLCILSSQDLCWNLTSFWPKLTFLWPKKIFGSAIAVSHLNVLTSAESPSGPVRQPVPDAPVHILHHALTFDVWTYACMPDEM